MKTKNVLLLLLFGLIPLSMQATYRYYIYDSTTDPNTGNYTINNWTFSAESSRKTPAWGYCSDGTWNPGPYGNHIVSSKMFNGKGKNSFLLASPREFEGISAVEFQISDKLRAVSIDSILLIKGDAETLDDYPSWRGNIPASVSVQRFGTDFENGIVNLSSLSYNGMVGIVFYLNSNVDSLYYSPFQIDYIKVTTYVDKVLSFDKDEITVSLGEAFTSPKLKAVTENAVRFATDDPHVAAVMQDGRLLPVGVGTTTIRAIDDADNEEASYVVHVVWPAGVEGSTETLVVETPGTLSRLAADLESTSIKNLTIKGRINANDLLTIKSGAGRFKNIESIDLKEAIIVPSQEAYTTMSWSSDIGMGTDTYNYYYSDENKVDFSFQQTGLGGSHNVYDVYTNQLDALFSGVKSLKKVVLPASAQGVGDLMFQGCSNLLTVQFPDSIRFVGDKAFSYCSHLIAVSLPSSVKRIGEGAFKACDSLIQVGDLSHVETIGASAFENCRTMVGDVNDMVLKLTALDDIPDYAFYGCGALHDIRFSKDLKHIGDYAFNGTLSLRDSYEYNDFDTELQEVYLPDGLLSIGDCAFAGRKALTSVHVPGSVEKLTYYSFSGTYFQDHLQADNSVYYVGRVAIGTDGSSSDIVLRDGTVAVASFFNESNLKTITFPDSLKYIGHSAFSECTLTEVVLPEGLEEIDQQAFWQSRSLTKCTLPSSLRFLKDRAFQGCTSLSTITIPEKVEEIGVWAFESCIALVQVKYNAIHASTVHYCNLINGGEQGYRIFYNCEGLDKAIIGNKVQHLPMGLFDNSGLLIVEFEEGRTQDDTLTVGKHVFKQCSRLLSCPLPEQTTAIGEYAFCGCSALADFAIPKNVKTIEEFTFYGCTSLLSDHLFTVGLKEIGLSAFEGCTSLTDVILPDGLETIGKEAFENCSGIEKIVIPEGVKRLERSVFHNCEFSELYLPSTLEYISGGNDRDAFYTEPSLRKKSDKLAFTIYSAATQHPSWQTAGGLPWGGEDLSLCKVYVPLSAIYDYEDAPEIGNVWKLFNLYPTALGKTALDKDNSVHQWYDVYGRPYDHQPDHQGIIIQRGKKYLLRQ